MNLNKLELINFRNYDKQIINFSTNINLFYGENSSGKTNIIEAIYYISTVKSFRCSEDIFLLKNDCDFFQISADITYENNINKKYCIEYNKINNKKNLKIDEKKIYRFNELIGKIPLVLFSPEHILLIKNEPQLRRRYIDNILINTDIEYYNLYNKFIKIVYQRNSILKLIKENKLNKKNIEVLNIQLKDLSIKIIEHRKKIIDNLNKIINLKLVEDDRKIELKYCIKKFDKINNDNLEIYFQDFFEKYIENEIVRCATLIGPHRDDIEIYLNDKLLKYYGSEGQQRLSCIILKLAEGLYIKEKLNVYPIVLLDDFTSELDETNKIFISKIFGNFKQIIITTTSKENIKNIRVDKCFFVENGRINDNEQDK